MSWDMIIGYLLGMAVMGLHYRVLAGHGRHGSAGSVVEGEMVNSNSADWQTADGTWWTRRDSPRLAALERVAEAAERCIWINDCRCDEAYTGRQMHEPNALCGEMDELAAALAELNRPSEPEEKK